MKVRFLEQLNIKKAALAAIIINSLQIAAVLALALYILLDGRTDTLRGVAGMTILCVLSLIVIWGAVVDIKEGVRAERVATKMGGLDETVRQMSDLNHALRAQRHDFLNHLQVVYSLIEMNDYKEARDYIERVYGDMKSVSQALKTKCAPVNALLRAKLAEGQARGVKMTANITAAWEELPLPAWEMCRVLSNLIDNALDALKETKNPEIIISLREDLRTFSFCVENNGPMIPLESQKKIFEAGVSTKGEGRGMGLSIARETLRAVQGDLTLSSDARRTAFSGFIPRRASVGTCPDSLS